MPARNATPPAPDEQVATFEDLVKEEQSLKDRMQSRLDEIRPAVEEAEKISAWLAEHTEQNGNQATTEPSTPVAALPSTPSQSGGQSGQRRGDARQKFLEVVRKHPNGITVAEAAKQLGRPPAYYYRLSADMKRDGVIKDAPNSQGIVLA